MRTQRELTSLLDNAVKRQKDEQKRATLRRKADRVPDAGQEPSGP